MSKEFEDMPDGGGKRATEDDYVRIWRYMLSRNRNPSIRSVLEELKAQNYKTPAVATSQRWAKKLGLSAEVVASTAKEAAKRQSRRRSDAKPVTVTEIADATGQDVPKVERTLLSRMKELMVETNSSTQLAITENRTRMAFNVALMEFYAENPQLLANVKDAAAFLDATTVAVKMSGGASIDIVLGKPGEEADSDVSPGGHLMKTVSPLAKLDGGIVASFKEFQAKLRDGAGA